VVYRDKAGYTQTRCAADMPGIAEFIAEGEKLGHLWVSGHFDAGDPLVHAGGKVPAKPDHTRKKAAG
jgi:hypothetical protein